MVQLNEMVEQFKALVLKRCMAFVWPDVHMYEI